MDEVLLKEICFVLRRAIADAEAATPQLPSASSLKRMNLDEEKVAEEVGGSFNSGN